MTDVSAYNMRTIRYYTCPHCFKRFKGVYDPRTPEVITYPKHDQNRAWRIVVFGVYVEPKVCSGSYTVVIED